MTTFIQLIMAVYGGSFAVLVGSGMLWIVSPSFRRFLTGDRHPL